MTNEETIHEARKPSTMVTFRFRHLSFVIRIFAATALSCFSHLPALTIESDFEGASVRIVHTDDAAQTVRFMPGGDPKRGWPCWWQFRLTGLDIAKPLTLELQASDLPMPQANGSPSNKPLAGEWAMADRASYSVDGKTWKHTEPGQKHDGRMIYILKAESPTLLVAWGPPYTPSRAAAFVHDAASGTASARELELCKSREGRSVPMLRVCEGNRLQTHRFGVWVEARQHAWEAGSSWVCQGFAEWLLGSDKDAAWLRLHAEIFIVPIMDVDNTATGNGGKEALPHDHNRDWMEKPNWNEVAAAQSHIREMAKEGRMDVFLDLHNPAPGDKRAFFYVLPDALVKEPMLTNRNRFIGLATSSVREVFPMLDKPKEDGPKYHPLWRQISGTWVSMNANPHTVATCLETSWNTPQSTVEGYKAVGAQLAKAVQSYLATMPPRS
jgi:hypothetical protein